MNTSQGKYWIGWALQGVIGLAFRVPFPVVALVLLVTGLLLYERAPRLREPEKSSVHGYHSHRAAKVLIIGFDVVTVAMLLLNYYGPRIGVEGIGAQLFALTVLGMVQWGIYQWARQRWPAGTD